MTTELRISTPKPTAKPEGYERLVAEWTAIKGFHSGGEEVLSDYLRSVKICDSKDKAGMGHKIYLRHVQINSKALKIGTRLRIEWIDERIKEYTEKARLSAETGVKKGIRIERGTGHNEAVVLAPGVKKTQAAESAKRIAELEAQLETATNVGLHLQNALEKELEIAQKTKMMTPIVTERIRRLEEALNIMP